MEVTSSCSNMLPACCKSTFLGGPRFSSGFRLWLTIPVYPQHKPGKGPLPGATHRELAWGRAATPGSRTVSWEFQLAQAQRKTFLTRVESPFTVILIILIYFGARDNAVGTETDYGLDGWEVGVRVPLGSRIFSSSCRLDLFWGSIQPPTHWVPGGSFPGRKTTGAWSWPFTSSYCRGQDNIV
jgi:hypothetical protein